MQSILLHLHSCFSRRSFDLSAVVKLFQRTLLSIVDLNLDGHTLRPNPLVGLPFCLHHIVKFHLQIILPILTGSYDQVFLSHITHRLIIEQQLPLDRVANISGWLLIIFAPSLPLSQWEKSELILRRLWHGTMWGGAKGYPVERPKSPGVGRTENRRPMFLRTVRRHR
ncbi:hypothetical protein BJX66DRAFT_192648 [Aspergillus keveii]|uniref:Uncharacterized protein n=1 Tax=Aspergillus keveii TaxID=714993 RepID=A0ABR4FGU8_9EURO